MLNQEVIKNKPVDVRTLYESYGAMLLGYIVAIVKDKEVAESYLVKIFSNISARFNHLEWDEGSAWQQLRNFAKHELAIFTDTVKACEYDTAPDDIINGTDNQYLNRMTGEQRQVFCSIYYHRYTIAQLAHQLDKPLAYITKTLKEAFYIIRQSHEN
ncbi:RNA polymerase sigma factor [Mucilaginibacter sp. AW1-3]